MMGRKAVGRHRFVSSDARDDSGREKGVKGVLPAPCPFEQEARDEVLGGISNDGHRGPISNFTFQIDIIAPSKVPVCSILYMGQNKGPIVRRLREKVRKSLMQRCKENHREEEKRCGGHRIRKGERV